MLGGARASSGGWHGGAVSVAHLDAGNGLSGTMWLGALVDVGASIERIDAAVQGLGVGDVRIVVARVRRGGAPATSVRVRPPQELPPARGWGDLRDILEEAALPGPVRDHGHAVFRRLAEAEAAVQGLAPEDVRIHDVAALDALGTVVGTCAAVHDLGLTGLTAGPIAVGAPSTSTRTDDAVARWLLDGFRIVDTGTDGPTVTPTGAALTAVLCRPVDTAPTGAGGRAGGRVGVGAGGHGSNRPQVLRLTVAGPLPGAGAGPDGPSDPHAERTRRDPRPPEMGDPA